jgi:hypothetical protein
LFKLIYKLDHHPVGDRVCLSSFRIFTNILQRCIDVDSESCDEFIRHFELLERFAQLMITNNIGMISPNLIEYVIIYNVDAALCLPGGWISTSS